MNLCTVSLSLSLRKYFYVMLNLGPREIRDQVYDEKQNTVTITVVCCSPEKIRDKLCCKGGKIIKNIEIKKPKSEEPDKKKKEEDKKTKPNGKQPDTPKPEPVVIPIPIGLVCCGGPCYEGYGRPPPPCSCGCGCGSSAGPCYDGHYRRPHDYVSRCDYYYFTEENPSACAIM
uniref:Uncharacterized protein n=1 Tax=Davidia involucrata TaxID=16924 RepID=A0A5B7AQ56_DAVIN